MDWLFVALVMAFPAAAFVYVLIRQWWQRRRAKRDASHARTPDRGGGNC
jgi:peptidoglycan/LPS O-acetylase OafA/YrhL